MNTKPNLDWEAFTGPKKSDTGTAFDNALIIKRLEKPTGPVDVVLDTDTFNEIDDQFALAYLIKSSDRLHLKAIYAAPFQNDKAANAKVGMEKSYDEIMNVLTLIGEEELKKIVYKGSDSFLPDEKTPVKSKAAEDLVNRSKGYSLEKPLYVIAIGAITNIASAILMDPDIINRIVLIWLGGHALDWPHNKEFNLHQDVASARIVFGCGVPMVQLPCMGVVSSFRLSGPEMEYHMRGKNKLCDYLIDVTEKEALEYGGNAAWTRAIWDVTAVGWLLDPGFMSDRLEPSPIPEYDHLYAFNKTRHPIKYVYYIDRDKLALDLFQKLSQ